MEGCGILSISPTRSTGWEEVWYVRYTMSLRRGCLVGERGAGRSLLVLLDVTAQVPRMASGSSRRCAGADKGRGPRGLARMEIERIPQLLEDFPSGR